MSVPTPLWFTFPIPAGIVDLSTVTPDRVAAYFTGKGYQVLDGAAIDAVNRQIIIGLDRDPSADLSAFAALPSVPLTTAEQAVAQAIAYLKNTYLPFVQAIPNATRTNEQRALLAILVILKAQLTR